MAKILLAEDDQAMRHFLKASLEKAGHSVNAFPDGLSALDDLRSNKTYDLLLSDIVMPGLDGLELARKAKSLHPSIKTLFITGFSAMALSPLSEDNIPAPQIVAKPFHLAGLIDQINALLAKNDGQET